MSEETKHCPFCAETIQAAAILCRYCGCDLPSLAPAKPAPQIVFVPGKVWPRCSECDGPVLLNATVCRHCKASFDSPSVSIAANTPPSSGMPAAPSAAGPILLLLVIVGCGVLWFMGAFGGGSHAPAAPLSHSGGTIEYTVTGDSGAVEIAYVNGGGEVDQIDGPGLPWSRLQYMSSGRKVMVTARNVSTNASLSCEITIDGTVVSNVSSAGEGALAICTAVVP